MLKAVVGIVGVVFEKLLNNPRLISSYMSVACYALPSFVKKTSTIVCI